MPASSRQILGLGLAAAAVLCFALWQPTVVANPPVEPANTMQAHLHPPATVNATLHRSCWNCHSNETSWPWYAHLRPIAGKIREHATEGRQALNFSEWKTQMKGDAQAEAKTLITSCTLMQAGMMPPEDFLYIHPGAKLAKAETRAFCEWANGTARRLTSTP